MELVIADPSASTTEAVKNSFQTIFTKCTKSSNAISHQEMCQRLLKNLDIDRRAVRFLMKQFVNDVNNQGQKSGNIGRAYEVLKQENTQLKQASSSQRLQMEQTIADLQHRVQALNGTVQGQQQKLQDKDKQLSRFRELYEADGMARIPSSSHSQSSGGKRGHSHMVNSSSSHHHHHQQHQQQQEQQHAQPPMQSFVMQKEARERAKEQAMGEFTRRGPVAARPMTNESSLLTPMQLPRRPLSTGSLSSASGHHQSQQQHQNQSHHASVPSTPRIRDLSSSNGYVFTSSASGRRNGGTSSAGHPMQHGNGNGNGSKHPRRTTDSPSGGGFAFNQGNQARQQQQQSHNYGASRFNSRG
jgi:hypothetical protein